MVLCAKDDLSDFNLKSSDEHKVLGTRFQEWFSYRSGEIKTAQSCPNPIAIEKTF